ncbi:MAG: hypothetical protein ACYTGC_00825, partial [Planctomycetota bacterium]
LVEEASSRGLLDSYFALERYPTSDRLELFNDTDATLLLAQMPLARQVYELLRDTEYPPFDSFCSALDLALQSRHAMLEDVGAETLLPPAQACKLLYRRLRELGYTPLEALRCILPHRKSYAI